MSHVTQAGLKLYVARGFLEHLSPLSLPLEHDRHTSLPLGAEPRALYARQAPYQQGHTAADEIVFTLTVCGVCLVLLLSGLFPLVGFEPFQWRGGDSKP